MQAWPVKVHNGTHACQLTSWNFMVWSCHLSSDRIVEIKATTCFLVILLLCSLQSSSYNFIKALKAVPITCIGRRNMNLILMIRVTPNYTANLHCFWWITTLKNKTHWGQHLNAVCNFGLELPVVIPL